MDSKINSSRMNTRINGSYTLNKAPELVGVFAVVTDVKAIFSTWVFTIPPLTPLSDIARRLDLAFKLASC